MAFIIICRYCIVFELAKVTKACKRDKDFEFMKKGKSIFMIFLIERLRIIFSYRVPSNTLISYLHQDNRCVHFVQKMQSEKILGVDVEVMELTVNWHDGDPRFIQNAMENGSVFKKQEIVLVKKVPISFLYSIWEEILISLAKRIYTLFNCYLWNYASQHVKMFWNTE